jgi:predicted MFS family arabinose efflux permease
MILAAFHRYTNNFRGFSREIWMLTLMTFINRAGTMVLPFLSKYLHEDLHLPLSEVSTIMVFFGLGSMLGSWLGGKLSDSIGFYKIMVFSLFTSGLAFFVLQYITSYIGLCIGMFAIMSIADMFRPAMFVSLSAYTKPEDRTRALTLVRLAINLGFAAGPAMGGLIIMNMGYRGLFWVDGFTCILAILVFWLTVKEVKKVTAPKDALVTADRESVFRDRTFWVFLMACVINGILFFQLFTSLPLYHSFQFKLTEFQTGLLMMMNGLLIFFFEMPLVGYIERHKIPKIKIITIGALLMTLSIFLLLINVWAGILIVMMLLMSFGEMFVFPFSNSFALSRAPKGHEGRYMAIFTMSFGFAHIFSSKIGLEAIYRYGYQINWLFMGGLGVISVLLMLWVSALVKKEKASSTFTNTSPLGAK